MGDIIQNLKETVPFLFSEDFLFFWKLNLAALVGIVLGLERESKKKAVGIKTLMVISVGSCLLTITSIESVVKFASLAENINMDPMRLAAQIVAGVGFLGAGVIMKKNDDVISGLTTAAIIWGVSGIGIAVGAGFYFEAIVATAMFYVGVEVLPKVLIKMPKQHFDERFYFISITLNRNEDIEDILHSLVRKDLTIKAVIIQDIEEEKKLVELKSFGDRKMKASEVYNFLREFEKIEKIEIRE